MSVFMKDPDAVLDYAVDWGPWLSGATITTATWIVPAGLTKGAESISGSSAKVMLSGGTIGQTYTVTCRVVTSTNVTDDRSFRVRVVSR